MRQEWILILGAGSDIAVATARRFAEEGYNIFLASRNLEELNKEALNLGIRHGVAAQALYFDALDKKSHELFYSELNPKPVGLILSFGLLGNRENTRDDVIPVQKTIDTNYTGAVSILETVARDFEIKQQGFIAAISSVAGDRGRQSNYIYGSAKAGLTTYLSGLRHRLYKKNVSVLTVKPGFVSTKMTAGLDLPERLTAKPSEVADRIYHGIKKRKNTIYVKPVWRWIMLIIIHLPEFIFKRTRL
jgi:short-subunit dehydrogenase